MRRISILITTIALVLSGIGLSPANAVGTYDAGTGSGTVECTTGYFTIASNVVTGNTSCTGDAVIPSGVTSIRNSAFNAATSLQTVTFAGTSSLQIIDNGAFYGATSLVAITIPAGVTTIGVSAFNRATSLKTVTFAGTSTPVTLLDGAFYGTSSLDSVYFFSDAAPTVLGSVGFYGVAAGAKAYIKRTATGFGVVGGDWNGLTTEVGVYTATYDSKSGSAVTPNSFISGGAITAAPSRPTLSGYTFAGWSDSDGGTPITFPFTPSTASDLTLSAKWIASYSEGTGSGGISCSTDGYFLITGNVVAELNSTCAGEAVIPSGVTSIGVNAFYSNVLITSVTIPNSVTSVDVRGFSDCLNLVSVTFESGSKLTTILASAFNSTYSLASIEIPYGVTSIGIAAFEWAGSLTNVTFLGNAPTVETRAFANIGASPAAHVSFTATGFTLTDDKWNGFTVAREFEDQKITADRVAHTIYVRTSYAAKSIATAVSVTRTSKAKVSLKVASSSKKICKVSKGKLKTLKSGSCKVTIKIQEPKKKGKLPKSKSYKHTFLVMDIK